MPKTGIALLVAFSAVAAILASACKSEPKVSFSQEVRPILEANCLSCHQAGGAGFEASGFSMVSYDDLMKGTKFGAMVIAGDAEGSNLVVLMEGRADPSISMPHGSIKKVAGRDIKTIRLWIDQGALNN